MFAGIQRLRSFFDKKVAFGLLLVVFVLAGAATAFLSILDSQTDSPYPRYTLVWKDEFNLSDGSSVDSSKWTYQNGDGSQYGIPGWGNEEYEWYREQNGWIENGKLVIKGEYEDGEWYSSKIITDDIAEWKYGIFEARIKMPTGFHGVAPSAWPAFWMMGNTSWPSCGEYDITEFGGLSPTITSSAFHWENSVEGYTSEGGELDAGKNLANDYHRYRLEWDNSSVKCYFDNQQVTSMDTTDLPDEAFRTKHWMILNLAIGGVFGRNAHTPNPQYYPQHMYVDWVRVYQKK